MGRPSAVWSGARSRQAQATSPWAANLLQFLSHLSSVSDFWLWWFFSWNCFPWRFGFAGIVRFAGFFAFYTNRLAERRQSLLQSLQRQCRFAPGPLLCEKRGRNGRTAAPATAACTRSRPRPAWCRAAPRAACSGSCRASWAGSRRPRRSRSCSGSASRSWGGCCSTTRSR